MTDFVASAVGNNRCADKCGDASRYEPVSAVDVRGVTLAPTADLFRGNDAKTD
jgi:hypothetical protein